MTVPGLTPMMTRMAVLGACVVQLAGCAGSGSPGAYGQTRYGIAMGTSNTGSRSIPNEAGVILRLKTTREGLILGLGGDDVEIPVSQ